VTRKEAIEKFRTHWRWLARHPAALKGTYPPLILEDIRNDCYLCGYVKPVFRGKGGAQYDACKENCPIKWPGGYCEHPRSPYKKYCECLFEGKEKQASKWAKEVSELPEREEE